MTLREKFAAQHLELADRFRHRLKPETAAFIDSMKSYQRNGALGEISQDQYNALKRVHNSIQNEIWRDL